MLLKFAFAWFNLLNLLWGFLSSWISVQWTGKKTWRQTPGCPCWRCSLESSRTRSFYGQRHTQQVKKKSENSIYLSCKHCAEIMFVYGTCLPCCSPVCSKSWGARSRTLPSQWGAWRTRRQWTATQTQPEWWHCSTAALSLGRTIFFMTSLNTSNTMNAYSSRLLILFLF